MKNQSNSTDQASTELTRRSESMLRPTGGLLNYFAKSKQERGRQSELTEQVMAEAREVKMLEVEKAAKVVATKIEVIREDSRNLAIIDHEKEMDTIELAAGRSAFKTMISIEESKAEKLREVDSVCGDSDLRERTRHWIEDVHTDANQAILNRNCDMLGDDEAG